MAYDEGLAQRVRDALSQRDVLDETVEKKMFGGLCFMVHGHMAVGLIGEELMVRVGPEGYEAALQQPHAREMDFTGKALKGMVYVSAEGAADDDALEGWLDRSLGYARSLPPKPPKGAARPRTRAR